MGSWCERSHQECCRFHLPRSASVSWFIIITLAHSIFVIFSDHHQSRSRPQTILPWEHGTMWRASSMTADTQKSMSMESFSNPAIFTASPCPRSLLRCISAGPHSLAQSMKFVFTIMLSLLLRYVPLSLSLSLSLSLFLRLMLYL